MSKETGFTTMAGAKAQAEAPEVGVGMLGYSFMGKAHSNAVQLEHSVRKKMLSFQNS